MFSFISSHHTVHIHNAVNTVCFMFTHSAVAGELQKAETEPKHPTYSTNPHISFPCTPSCPQSHSTTLRHDSLFCANIVEFSNYQWVVIFYRFFFFFFFHCRANCQDLSQILKPHSVIQAGSKCSCSLVENLVRRGNICDWDFPGYDSQFFPNNVNKTCIGSGCRNTFSSGLKRDWFPNEHSIKTFGITLM